MTQAGQRKLLYSNWTCTSIVQILILYEYFNISFSFLVLSHTCMRSLTTTVEILGEDSPLGIHVVPYCSSLSGRWVFMQSNVLMNSHSCSTLYHILKMCSGFLHPSMVTYCQSHKYTEKIKLKEGSLQVFFFLSSRHWFILCFCSWHELLNSALISSLFLFFPPVIFCSFHPFLPFSMFTFSSLSWLHLIAAELSWAVDIKLPTHCLVSLTVTYLLTFITFTPLFCVSPFVFVCPPICLNIPLCERIFYQFTAVIQ